MDSITQMALGAAVGEAVLGRRIGHRAALYGAVIGTLPDLDVLIPLGDPIADFTYHRSASHSLIVLTLVAPLLAWCLSRIPRRDDPGFRPWWLMTFLVLVTHPLLDGFTVYGTQLLWPLPVAPTSWSTLFIIDPAYTLPLIVGVLGTAWLRRRNRATQRPPPWRLNAAGLVLSTTYIAWSLVAKQIVDGDVRRALAEQGHEAEHFVSTPAPFTTLLWRVVAMEDDGYLEAFVSLVDGDDGVTFASFPSDPALLEGLEADWRVRRLAWFTHGFYSVRLIGEDILITDLRMGTEPDYVFAFRIGTRGNPHPRAAPTLQRSQRFDAARLGTLFRRITDPFVDMRPPPVAPGSPSIR